MFQPAVPVAKVLEGIHNSEYVLPAIQREFVWKTDQIRGLFDSLMRGYPIGAFLFWTLMLLVWHIRKSQYRELGA